MYPASAAVRWKFTGVTYRPVRSAPQTTSYHSCRLWSITARWSPVRSPRARRSCATRFERASSWAKVVTSPVPAITRAGSSPDRRRTPRGVAGGLPCPATVADTHVRFDYGPADGHRWGREHGRDGRGHRPREHRWRHRSQSRGRRPRRDRVSDADPERAGAIDGATIARDAAAVGAACAVTITSLPTPEVVEAVADGVGRGAPPGSILLDLSTSDPGRQPAPRRAARADRATTSWRRRSPAAPSAPRSGRWCSWSAATTSPWRVAARSSTGSVGPRSTSVPSVPASTMKLVNSLLAFTCSWVSLEGLSWPPPPASTSGRQSTWCVPEGRRTSTSTGVSTASTPGAGPRSSLSAWRRRTPGSSTKWPPSPTYRPRWRRPSPPCWPTPSSAASATTTGAISPRPPSSDRASRSRLGPEAGEA